VNEILSPGKNKKGIAPKNDNTTQNSTTIIKPSRSLISAEAFFDGSHKRQPKKSVAKKEYKKGAIFCSW
jgi:hypothetical protein